MKTSERAASIDRSPFAPTFRPPLNEGVMR